MALSDRIRPNVEASSWVVEEVKALENKIRSLQRKLEKSKETLKYYASPMNWDEHRTVNNIRRFIVMKNDGYFPEYQDEEFGGARAVRTLALISDDMEKL